MAEAFIYFYVVAADLTDVMARRVVAKAVHDKVVFFDENPGYVDADEIREWRRDTLIAVLWMLG